ncbi:thiamine-phosphate kinase [Vibrio sp. WXL210]|uniref:thiamine-phosphate kinase n=1 Tax=Vibrio sp. WXL210 TaxID=3450709 RepID=UPI003EC8F9A5
MAGEFNLIEKYFVDRQARRSDVLLAAGDDCALLEVPEGMSIALSTDSLVAGTHFLADAPPAWVAHKALASNLSDLAAMGATPAWVSMALTMPEPDEAWLAPFCEAFFALADRYNLKLIGGDTTKGPLSITLTVQGFVPKGQALRRSGAQVGDSIYVTGQLGDSKAGLDVILNPSQQERPEAQALVKRHFHATPRIEVGEALRPFASAAIDISDGLISDLGHILKASKVGADINVDALPLSASLLSFVASHSLARQYALTSGEEYELCFTAPLQHQAQLDHIAAQCGVALTCIGTIHTAPQLTLHASGEPLDWTISGYDHFKETP